jgi:nitrate reductase gamma subunit
MNALNNFLFIALPYVAIVVFLVGNIYRYVSTQFKYSSLSAQFLEDQQGFWGTVPFHIAILMLFLGHLAIFLVPDATLAWNSDPVRLIIHEGVAFTFGLTVLIALVGLMLRRLFNKRLRVVTSKMDVVIELLLLAQVVLGCWIALGYRWGTSWFAADLTPYLWSIFQLDPQIQAVSALPVVIKLHIVGGASLLYRYGI